MRPLGIGLGLGLNARRLGGGEPPVPAAPVITSSSISGTPEDGQTLTANRTVMGYPSPAISYQWQHEGTNISGETAQTIVLDMAAMGLADGDMISCEITATNSEGSDTAEPAIAFVYVEPPAATIYNTNSDSDLPGSEVDGFLSWAQDLDDRLTLLEAA